MARRNTTSYRFISALVCTVLSIGSTVVDADQEGLTDDGREVLLKEDGTWEFRSTDRFANTKDGQRVRLRADNTWEYVGNVALTAKDQIRTTLLDIKLKEAVFEVHIEKAHKNVRKNSQTVFYLNIHVSPAATENITISNTDLSRIQVRDNKGNVYPVLSLRPGPISLTPDSEHAVTIRAKGAPSVWDNAKSMELELQSGVLGNDAAITFSQNISDMEKKKVAGFEQTK